jgi:elongation factor 1-beta
VAQAGLAELEVLLGKQLWVGGDQPSDADNECFTRMMNENIRADTNPNVFGWFNLVMLFTEKIRLSWKPPAPAKAAKGAKGGKGKGKDAKKDTKKEEDDLDLFGDDDEEDAAAAKAAAEAAKNKKKKEKPPEMSLIIFEVKPVDDTTDLDALAKRIFS